MIVVSSFVSIITILFGGIALLYWFFRTKYKFFENLNLPGPKPSFPLGNLAQVDRNGLLGPIHKWSKQYGSVFGYFEGPTPVLVVSDPELVKNILVTDFNNFRDRKPFPLVPPDPKGLFVANEHRWRWLRPLLTPAFTASKVKQMSPSITDSVKVLMEVMEAQSNTDKAVDIHRLFQGLTLDVIGKVAFGFQTDSLRDPNDKMLVKTQKIFKNIGATVFHILAIMLPWLDGVLIFLRQKVFAWMYDNPLEGLRQDLLQVMKFRKQEGTTERADFLQLLINIQKDGKKELFQCTSGRKKYANGDSNDLCTNNDKEEHNAHDMTTEFTDEEIIAQAFTILLAGYETTANMLAYTAYLLALNPEIQDKLYEEINTHITSEEEATCENTQKLRYLDMVVNEVLRMYSTAALLVTRKSKESRTYGSVHIPANTNIVINLWSLHYDETHWPEPEKFNPQRFTNEAKVARHPYAFVPFGGGPRNCIGMRFALMEMKVVLVRILKNYMFLKCPETQVPLPLLSKAAIIPKNGVYVQLRTRDGSHETL